MRWYRELLPTLPEELNGWIGLLTIPPVPRRSPRTSGAARPAASSGATPGRTRRPRRRWRRCATSAPRCWWVCTRCPSTCCSRPSTRCTRRAAMVLAGRLRHGDLRRRHRDPRQARRGAAHRASRPCTCTRSTGLRPGFRLDDTAFAYRDGGWAGVIVGVDPDPANAQLITDWASAYYDELHPTTAGGGYVNFIMDERARTGSAPSYRENYDRLARIKAHYDPANLFHVNQNIRAGEMTARRWVAARLGKCSTLVSQAESPRENPQSPGSLPNSAPCSSTPTRSPVPSWNPGPRPGGHRRGLRPRGAGHRRRAGPPGAGGAGLCRRNGPGKTELHHPPARARRGRPAARRGAGGRCRRPGHPAVGGDRAGGRLRPGHRGRRAASGTPAPHGARTAGWPRPMPGPALHAQATDEERAAVADIVINNSGSLEELRQQVNEIWETHIAPSISRAR